MSRRSHQRVSTLVHGAPDWRWTRWHRGRWFWRCRSVNVGSPKARSKCSLACGDVWRGCGLRPERLGSAGVGAGRHFDTSMRYRGCAPSPLSIRRRSLVGRPKAGSRAVSMFAGAGRNGGGFLLSPSVSVPCTGWQRRAARFRACRRPTARFRTTPINARASVSSDSVRKARRTSSTRQHTAAGRCSVPRRRWCWHFQRSRTEERRAQRHPQLGLAPG
jgi:hypothetical protein